MKIEVGKSYINRVGKITTIASYDEGRGGSWPFIGSKADDDGLYNHSWDTDGYLVESATPDNGDLIAEVIHVAPVQMQPRYVKPDCLVPEDSDARKGIPVTTGVLDYFPLALVAVAQLSKAGNDKHNPGEPLHWARGKSTDHADCIGRHLIDRGRFAEDGTRHSAALAWRALALLQEELEAEAGLGHVSR